MNIKRAKEELKHTIEAYLKKDEFGNYKIPPVKSVGNNKHYKTDYITVFLNIQLFR